jgi:hypothetical protein
MYLFHDNEEKILGIDGMTALAVTVDAKTSHVVEAVYRK